MRASLLELLVMLATILQWLVLSTLTGLLVGSGVSLFLYGLAMVTDPGFTSVATEWRLLVLPLGGIVNGLIFYYGRRLNRTSLKDNMFAAFHEQEGRMPLSTLLLKPIAALVTLGSGGSAGKEGPCSHIGAALGVGVGRVLRLNIELRKRLVACGVSAGFASVFGTPMAGAIYGVEVLAVGRVRTDFLLPAIIGGITSYHVSQFWRVPYEDYHLDVIPAFSESLFLATLVIGILCGFAARVYVDLYHAIRRLSDRIREHWQLWPPLMPLIGGLLVALLVFAIPVDYLGLSIPLMDSALHGEAAPYFGFLWKSLLVAITLGSGFYGGVVTPQFVIGAITGNAFAHFFGIDPTLGAAVGLAAVVASASNTPIAAILLGVELFGGSILPYTGGAVVAAYLLSGHHSIYPEQRLAYPKSSWLETRPDLPVGQGKIRLSYGLLKWWEKFRNR